MLVDANLLLYAANGQAPEHERAAAWLEEQLNGNSRVGLPWESLIAFVRLATSARAIARPLSAAAAWRFVQDWLAAPVTWTPLPTEQHADVFGGLITKYRLTGKLVPDGHIAALAIEHGLDVCSADTDFARFTEVRWVNPLAE
jgi:toxin-antitoxin system PIN domain toxin